MILFFIVMDEFKGLFGLNSPAGVRLSSDVQITIQDLILNSRFLCEDDIELLRRVVRFCDVTYFVDYKPTIERVCQDPSGKFTKFTPEDLARLKHLDDYLDVPAARWVLLAHQEGKNPQLEYQLLVDMMAIGFPVPWYLMYENTYITQAITTGNLTLLEWYRTNTKAFANHDLALEYKIAAVFSNRIPVLEWFATNLWFGRVGKDIGKNRVAKCNLTTLQWLVAHGFSFNSDCLFAGVERGDVEILNYIWEQGQSLTWKPNWFLIPIKAGNIPVMEWIKTHGYAMYKFEIEVKYATRQLDILRWLFDNDRIPQCLRSLGVLIEHGAKIDVLEWAKSKEFDHRDGYHAAIRKSDKATFQWLSANYPPPGVGFWEWVGKFGHVIAIELADEHGVPVDWDSVMFWATKQKKTDVVQACRRVTQ